MSLDPAELAIRQIISEAIPATAPGWNAIEILGALQAAGRYLSSENLWYTLAGMVEREEIQVANPIRIRSDPRRYMQKS